MRHPRRAKLIKVSNQFLSDLFRYLLPGLPPDATISDLRSSVDSDTIVLKVESSSFPYVIEGSFYPVEYYAACDLETMAAKILEKPHMKELCDIVNGA